MGDIVIRPGHDPQPVDQKETASSKDPDLSSLSADVYSMEVIDDPYNPDQKEVIETPRAVQGSLDINKYQRHRRTLGVDATVTKDGLSTKSMIVIGPEFNDAGLMFDGPTTTGGVYLDFDTKSHQYVIKGRQADSGYQGKFPGFTIASSSYTFKDDQIFWKYNDKAGEILKRDVGEAAFNGLQTYLEKEGAAKKPITIQDTTAFYDFNRPYLSGLIDLQQIAYQSLLTQNLISQIPPIRLGEMLYQEGAEGALDVALLCYDESTKQIIIPPPADYATDANIELIAVHIEKGGLQLERNQNKEDPNIKRTNPLAECLMPWLSKNDDDPSFMVALVRFGFLRVASEINFETQTVAFSNKESAHTFVDQLFGVDKRHALNLQAEQQQPNQRSTSQMLYSAETYSTPSGGGLHFWFFEGAKKTTDMYGGKGTDDNAILSIAAYDDLRYAVEHPIEQPYDYNQQLSQAGLQTLSPLPEDRDRASHAISLPILTKIEGSAAEVYTGDDMWSLFTREGIGGILNGYSLPKGWRLPTPEELQEFMRTDLHRCMVPNGPNGRLITNEFGIPTGSITVLSDQYMMRYAATAHGNPMPIAFIESPYQPITPLQDIGGIEPGTSNKLESWHDLPGWYSYEQAYVLSQVCNLANKTDAGFESSVRRREDEGFRYENPDSENGFFQDTAQFFDYVPIGLPGIDVAEWSRNEPTDVSVKVARYAVQYDAGIFATERDAVLNLVAQAELRGENFIVYRGEQLSLDDANELARGLDWAFKGPVEAFGEWYIKHGYTIPSALLGVVALILIIAWPSIKAALLADKATTFLVAEAKNVVEPTIEGRTDEMRSVFQYYYNFRYRKADVHKFGVLTAESRVGKSALFQGMAEALASGRYPDGTSVEPEFRDFFGEIMVVNMADLKLEAGSWVRGMANALMRRVKQAEAYSRTHPGKVCLLIVDEGTDALLGESDDTSARGEDDAKKLIHELKPRTNLFLMVVSTTGDARRIAGHPDRQIRERFPVIPVPLPQPVAYMDGTGEIQTTTNANQFVGMSELSPYHTLNYLYREFSNGGQVNTLVERGVLQAVTAEDAVQFLMTLICAADQRRESPDTKRSEEELIQYLGWLRRQHQRTGNPQDLLGNFAQYLREVVPPVTDRTEIQRRIAARGGSLTLDSFSPPQYRTPVAPLTGRIRYNGPAPALIRHPVARVLWEINKRRGKKSANPGGRPRAPLPSGPPQEASQSENYVASLTPEMRDRLIRAVGDGQNVNRLHELGFTPSQMMAVAPMLQNPLGVQNLNALIGMGLSPEGVLAVMVEPSLQQEVVRIQGENQGNPQGVVQQIRAAVERYLAAHGGSGQMGDAEDAPGEGLADLNLDRDMQRGVGEDGTLYFGNTSPPEGYAPVGRGEGQDFLEDRPLEEQVTARATRLLSGRYLQQVTPHTRVIEGETAAGRESRLERLNILNTALIQAEEFVAESRRMDAATLQETVDQHMATAMRTVTELSAPAVTGARPVAPGMGIRAPEQIDSELMSRLDQAQRSLQGMNPQQQAQARREVLQYIATHANLAADGVCGLMHRQALLIATQAQAYGLNIRDIERVQFAMVQATNELIQAHDGDNQDPEALAGVIQVEFQGRLDGLFPTAGYQEALAQRVASYRRTVGTSGSENITSYLTTSSQRRRRSH